MRPACPSAGPSSPILSLSVRGAKPEDSSPTWPLVLPYHVVVPAQAFLLRKRMSKRMGVLIGFACRLG